MSSEASSTLTDEAVALRLRQAVLDLNDAIADAASVGMEATLSIVDHQSVGSLVKRPIVSARLMRPISEA